MKYILILFFFGSFVTGKAQTKDTVRLCVWNLQKYDSTESQERLASIRIVLQAVQPDILVIQGFTKDTTNSFFQDIVQTLPFASGYREAPQIFKRQRPNPLESRLYYSPNFNHLESITIESSLHEDLFCRLLFSDAAIHDTLNIFATFFRQANEYDRESQATQVKSFFSGKGLRMTAVIGGLYARDEGDRSYRILTAGFTPNSIFAYDPLGREWQPDSSQYLSMYTNSTRYNNESGCDTTHGNGLKYRYDFILNRWDLQEQYIPNSYTVFGNDGIDRRNSSITDPPNQIVSQEIAEALQCASSHLPVYADYVFGKATSVEEISPRSFHFSVTPNPVSSQSRITFTLVKESTVTVSIVTLEGKEVQQAFKGIGKVGENILLWNTEQLASGKYFIHCVIDGKKAILPCTILR